MADASVGVDSIQSRKWDRPPAREHQGASGRRVPRAAIAVFAFLLLLFLNTGRRGHGDRRHIKVSC